MITLRDEISENIIKYMIFIIKHIQQQILHYKELENLKIIEKKLYLTLLRCKSDINVIFDCLIIQVEFLKLKLKLT